MKGYTPEYKHRFTRDEYEKACKILGFVPVPDADLGDYGDKFGDWRPVHTDAGWLTAEPQSGRWLRQQRFFQLRREQPKASPAPQTQPQPKLHPWGSRGTRWDEACECCGQETQIDNSSNLCRSCH